MANKEIIVMRGPAAATALERKGLHRLVNLSIPKGPPQVQKYVIMISCPAVINLLVKIYCILPYLFPSTFSITKSDSTGIMEGSGTITKSLDMSFVSSSGAGEVNIGTDKSTAQSSPRDRVLAATESLYSMHQALPLRKK
jgi:hypothetical protein